MKILAFSDMHAHLFKDFSEVDEVTGNTRFTSQIEAFKFMRNYCFENDIKHVLEGGDLFHARNAVNTVVYNAVYDEIKKFGESGLEVVLIPGNHTQATNEDMPPHSLKPFKEIINVTVLDTFDPFYIHGVNESVCIYPSPYSKNSELVKEAISGYAEHSKDNSENCTNVLLAHLGISGAFVGKSNYAMADAFSYEDLRPDAFDFGILGHFHKRQELGGNPNFFYTGSPVQHNFGDEGQEKGFMVIDTETKTAEFIPIPSPKFITVKVTDPKEIEKIQEELKGNFIRFQVDAEKVDSLVGSIQEGQKFRIEAQKEYKEERRVDVDFSMSFTEIVTEYAKKFKPEALNAGLRILREVESQ